MHHVQCTAILNLRPEVFHSVKFGDETKIRLPCFAFVVLEKPKSPPANQRRVRLTAGSFVKWLINNLFHWKRFTMKLLNLVLG